MKIANLYGVALSAASDRTSAAFDLGDLDVFAIAVVFTGTDLAGTLTLQCANDNINANYVTVANSSQAITLSGDHVWNVTQAGYRWVRVFWDYTSGTGNIQAQIVVKERVVKGC